MPGLLAAPDKFRGTVTARQAAEAMARGASARGWSVGQLPLSDGGEGLLDALGSLGGVVETVEVDGPLGAPVSARWLRIGELAVVEMAQASGLALVGGARGNDPERADTRGTGQLILAAARAVAAPMGGERTGPATGPGGARGRVVVGLGGSATTDGGLGALSAIVEAGGLRGVELIGACDVEVGFVEAAARFGPQKGADPAQVVLLEHRLEGVARLYERQYGVDVREEPGTGAAGGLGGAIVALGGRLRSGYGVVTELLGFSAALRGCQLVVTGEGAFDATSLLGKVVGSVMGDASSLGVPVLIIAGQVASEARGAAEAVGASVVSLTEQFGAERSRSDTARCIEEVVAAHLGP